MHKLQGTLSRPYSLDFILCCDIQMKANCRFPLTRIFVYYVMLGRQLDGLIYTIQAHPETQIYIYPAAVSGMQFSLLYSLPTSQHTRLALPSFGHILNCTMSIRRSKTMPTDGPTAKFLYTIIKQLDLKSVR